jgi:dihydrolipoamide dehydrogenase
LAEFGVEYQPPRIDLDRLRAWTREVIKRLAAGLADLCKRRPSLRVFRARGTFVDPRTLELSGTNADGASGPATVWFRHAIIATGSIPAAPPALRLDDPRVMDSTSALELVEIPQRLLVIGGGYIGLELGSVYATLGSRVTLVELTDGILPGVDRDLVRPLERRLERLLAAVLTKTRVTKLIPRDAGIEANIDGSAVEIGSIFDRVLIAVGRRPNSDGLGLSRIDVQVDEHGFIKVDAERRTTNPSIFAIGDVAGEPMLAHKAICEAKVAVAALVGGAASFDSLTLPAVVFTDPQIAWCGLTETAAKAAGRTLQVVRCPWSASGRAQTLGRTDGMTKLVVDPMNQRVLGVGIVGFGAGELIAEGVLAVKSQLTASELGAAVHAHPTLSETLGEAGAACVGLSTHLFRPQR